MTTLAQKITASLLKGRSILPRRAVKAATPITPEEAIAAITKFADLLESLAVARKTMDSASAIATDTNSKNLSDIILAGETLPDLGRLADNAQAAQVRARTTVQALNRLLQRTNAATVRLAQVKGGILERVEAETRAALIRPEWMASHDFEIAVMRSPQVVNLRILSQALRPHIPMVRGEAGAELPYFRVEPLAASLGSFDPMQPADSFDPMQLAGKLRAWLLHLEQVQALENPAREEI